MCRINENDFFEHFFIDIPGFSGSENRLKFTECRSVFPNRFWLWLLLSTQPQLPILYTGADTGRGGWGLQPPLLSKILNFARSFRGLWRLQPPLLSIFLHAVVHRQNPPSPPPLLFINNPPFSEILYPPLIHVHVYLYRYVTQDQTPSYTTTATHITSDTLSTHNLSYMYMFMYPHPHHTMQIPSAHTCNQICQRFIIYEVSMHS